MMIPGCLPPLNIPELDCLPNFEAKIAHLMSLYARGLTPVIVETEEKENEINKTAEIYTE